MRTFALFALFILPCTAAVIPVVQGVTSTGALISYTAPTSAECNVVVSRNGAEVNDTNEVLFPGSSLDSRTGNVKNGAFRQFVVGMNNSMLASDGAMYSRALEADAYFTGVVTCPGPQTGTFAFRTNTIPLGNTSPNPFPYNASGFGNYGFPTIRYSNLCQTYVDPQTGALLKNFTNSGFAAAGVHPDPWFHIYDLGNVWANESNLINGGTSTFTGTGGQNTALFVPFHFQDDNRGYIFSLSVYIDDVRAKLQAGSSAANDSLTACMVAYGDMTTCLGVPFTIAIPQGSPAAVQGPLSFPLFRFAGWGSPTWRAEQAENDVPDGSVSVTGTVVTNTTSQTFPMPFTFPQTLRAGTHILIAGSDPTCPLNDCTVASVQSGSRLTINQNLGAFGGASTTVSTMPNAGTFTVGNAGGFIPIQRFNAKAWFAHIGSEDVFCSGLSSNTFSGCNGSTVWPVGTAVSSHSFTLENWGMLIWPTAGASRTVTLAGAGSYDYASSADYTNGVEGDGLVCGGPDITVSFAADGVTPMPPVSAKACMVHPQWNDGLGGAIPSLGILIPSAGEFRTIARLSGAGNSQDPSNPLTIYESDSLGNVSACTYDATNGHFRELPHTYVVPNVNPYLPCSSSPIITNGVSQITAAYPQIDLTFFGQPHFSGKVGKYVTYTMNPFQDSLAWGCAFDTTKTPGTELIACQDLFSHPGMRWGDQHGGGFSMTSDNGWARFFSGDLGNLGSPSGPYRIAVTAVTNNGGVPSLTSGFDDPRTCQAMGASVAMQAKGAIGNNCIEITTPAEPLHTGPPLNELTTTGTVGAKPQRWIHNSSTCSPGAGDNATPAALNALGQGFNCSSFLQGLIEGDWLKDTNPSDTTGQEYFMVAKKTTNANGSLTLVLRRQISAGNFPTDNSQAWCVGQQGTHSSGSAVWYLKTVPERICGGNLYWTDVSGAAYATSTPTWFIDDPNGYSTHTNLVYTPLTENFANWSVSSANLGGN